jgi:hypothetical protein
MPLIQTRLSAVTCDFGPRVDLASRTGAADLVNTSLPAGLRWGGSRATHRRAPGRQRRQRTFGRESLPGEESHQSFICRSGTTSSDLLLLQQCQSRRRTLSVAVAAVSHLCRSSRGAVGATRRQRTQSNRWGEAIRSLRHRNSSSSSRRR